MRLSSRDRAKARPRSRAQEGGFCQDLGWSVGQSFLADVLGCRRSKRCGKCPGGQQGLFNGLQQFLPWAPSSSSSRSGATKDRGGRNLPDVEEEDSDSESGDMEWLPPTFVEAGAKYTGQWRSNRRHGDGVLERPDGGLYEGQFRRGKAHGSGSFSAANGNRYEGQWKADKAHGEGTYTKPNGSVYKGQWVEDRRSGRGSETWSNGSCYTGEYLHGKKHGRGVYLEPNELQYEGEFQRDVMHGEGTYHWPGPDKRVYTGQWREGEISGQGKMSWSSGASYEGSYLANEKSGQGVFTWRDGRIYRGQWSRGMQHGQGELFDRSGRLTTRGAWVNGWLISATSSGESEDGGTEASVLSVDWRERAFSGSKDCCAGPCGRSLD